MKASIQLDLLLLVGTTLLVSSFQLTTSFRSATIPSVRKQLGEERRRILNNAIAVSVEELEKDLTPAERSITGVVRRCGQSVAFVTSVVPATTSGSRRSKKTQRGSGKDDGSSDLPPGVYLGSGSGFVVAPGYLCTNFHVIERAYTIQSNAKMVETMLDQVAGNLTGGLLSEDFLNFTKSYVLTQLQGFNMELPRVYVRINSSTKFQKCDIVGVRPDIDLAVLKVVEVAAADGDDAKDDGGPDGYCAVSFGSSGDLLVGQSVVAIGNPFGLDKTVTAGVVSAVNREFRAGTARTPANTPIRNVIQTDASINPGNSGGPLLNLRGEVVGINTAILTTSGSSAGIGFAVPADQIKPAVEDILRQDRIDSGQRPNQGWLGVSVVRQDVVKVNKDGSKGSDGNTTAAATIIPMAETKNWIFKVERNSPASGAGLRPLIITEAGIVNYGDAIVAVGGNEVATFEELQAQFEDRVVGEQVALTVENALKERRVVYVTLSRRAAN